jgi:hypothetical protein
MNKIADAKPKRHDYQDLLSIVTPDDGWEIDKVFAATYSLSLKGLAMLIMAMAKTWTQEGKPGSKADFVKAVEMMRGKCYVIGQPTRSQTIPNENSNCLHVLDQFYTEYSASVNVPHSWHPKCVLIRMVPDKAKSSSRKKNSTEFAWRFWFGSKNLTLPQNLDLGMTVVGKPSVSGSFESDELVDVAQLLFRQLPNSELSRSEKRKLLKELSTVDWKFPRGFECEALRLLDPNEHRSRKLPKLPADTSELMLVSPFLDEKYLTHVVGQTNSAKKRSLITSEYEHSRFKSIDGYFRLIFNNAYPVSLSSAADNKEEKSDIEVGSSEDDATGEILSGLHAKFILGRTPTDYYLWMGSANATHRGWCRNAEIVGRFTITQTVYQRLRTAITDRHIDECEADDLSDPEELDEAEENRQKIVKVRMEIEQALMKERIVMRRPQKGVEIEFPKSVIGILKSDAGFRFSCSMLNGASVPVRQRLVTLENVPYYRISKFIELKIELGEEADVFSVKGWFDELNTVKRDHAFFSTYLSANAFMDLIYRELAGVKRPRSEDSWDSGRDNENSLEQELEGRNPTGRAVLRALPTVEMILRTWSIDPGVLLRVKRHLESAVSLATEEDSTWKPKEKIAIKEFQGIFNNIVNGLKGRI